MFNRKQYKEEALKALKGRWMWPCIISAVCLILSFCFNTIDGDFSSSGYHVSAGWEINISSSSSALEGLISILTFLAEGVILIALSHVFLELIAGIKKIGFNTFLEGLEKWLQGILGILWFSLWVFLWSLLLIIPGIIKSIAYSQMFFLLAEYPGMGVMKAMNISKIMTKGHKADLFIMGLSFLGWTILSLLSFGIGLIWLCPYAFTAYSYSYQALKQEALRTGNLVPADFN